MAAPSISKEFYLQVINHEDRVAFLKALVDADPPRAEEEWLDFKGAEKIGDGDVKRLWSKALSGFANTGGGVLIWGIDARKNKVTRIDAASALSLVPDVNEFKSRLQELHHASTDPPVVGVEIKPYPIDATSSAGFVVCFVPESATKPHRAEHCDKQWWLRAGDDFVVMPVSILRQLFYPKRSVQLKLTATVKHWDARAFDDGVRTKVEIDFNLANIGNGTAEDAFVSVNTAEAVEVTSSDPGVWCMCGQNSNSSRKITTFRALTSIHPYQSVPFFRAGPSWVKLECSNGQEGKPLSFQIRFFARNEQPLEILQNFDDEELRRLDSAKESKTARSSVVDGGESGVL